MLDLSYWLDLFCQDKYFQWKSPEQTYMTFNDIKTGEQKTYARLKQNRHYQVLLDTCWDNLDIIR